MLTFETLPRILVVDDEPEILSLAQELLAHMDEKAFVARSGEDALEIVREHSGIQLVITDLIMSGMNGLELITVLERMHPQMKFLICTSAPGSIPEEERQRPILEKPYDFSEFNQTVTFMLAM